MRRAMAILGVLVVVAGCATKGDVRWPEVAGAARPWTSEAFNNDPAVFRFAIVSDRNGGYREGIFPEAIEKLNMLQPEFVINVGDLIAGYSEDAEKVIGEYAEVDAELAPLEMPFFRVPGNHDITNETMVRLYHERYGRSYYHFRYKDVLFLCLNSEDPPQNNLSEAQLAYFSQALADNADARWTLVFLHKPLWLDGFDGTGSAEGLNWLRFESMLQDRPYTVFAGHTHMYTLYERLGRDYYIFSTTGGGSDLRGPEAGEFDHIIWVTMAQDGPRVANLLLDGILPGDVFTEDMVAVDLPRAPHSFTFTPVWGSPERFRSGTSTVTVQNPSSVPVDVELRFDAHPRMLVAVSEPAFTLAPKSEKTVELALTAFESTAASELEPVRGEAAFILASQGDRVRRIEDPLTFAVQPRRPIPIRKGITVDGDLSEWSWQALPYMVEQPAQIQFNKQAWQGPRDGSFRFGVAMDDTYLYVAVVVQDDELQTREGNYPWEQDSVELRVNALPDPQRSQSRGLKEFEDILLLAIVPGQTEQEAFAKERLPEGFRAVSRKTADGHVTEVAIPHAYLNEKQGGSWEAVRLNVAVDDHDADGGAQIWWQPDWRTPDTLTGSGTFQR